MPLGAVEQDVSVEWNVTTEDGVLDCYRATIVEVFRYAARLTGDRRQAEDLVQDVYLSLVRHASDGKVECIGVGWLITSTRNRFLNVLSAQRSGEGRLRLVDVPPQQQEPSADETEALLAPLPERERTAVVLRYVLDLPVADVADRLGLSRRATESLLVRARARMRLHVDRSEVRDA